jgi:hypothetical protein
VLGSSIPYGAQAEDDTTTDHDLFPTETAGLTDVGRPEVDQLADGDR